MKKTIRLTESDLVKIVRKVISEQENKPKTPQEVLTCMGLTTLKSKSCMSIIPKLMKGQIPTSFDDLLVYGQCVSDLATNKKTVEELMKCVGNENLPISF